MKKKIKKRVFVLIILALILSVGVSLLLKFNFEKTSNQNSSKYYINEDPAFCSKLQFACKENFAPFYDSTGCGCELKVAAQKKVYCADNQRNSGVCAEIYAPVCGFFDPQKIQCVKYPCAQTFSNSCFACSNKNVLYYTSGECPA